MPRPKSDNTFQVAFKVPEEWLTLADEVAEALSQPPIVTTRTDVLRAALSLGLESMHAKHARSRSKRARPKR